MNTILSVSQSLFVLLKIALACSRGSVEAEAQPDLTPNKKLFSTVNSDSTHNPDAAVVGGF